MKQKITIKTIAKELGVSTSTVSKALRDSHEISSDTKEKIQKANLSSTNVLGHNG